MHATLTGYGAFLFRYRNIAFPIIAILLLVAFEPGRSPTGRREIFADLIGFALGAAGQAIHLATLGAARIRRGGQINRIHADRLLTTGWYAHCRNPIYIGNLLVIAGLLIMFNNPVLFAAALAGAVFSYHAIVVTEEAYLADRFGAEYRAYSKRVPRWWPILRGLRATMRAAPFDWRWAIAKSYTSMYSWVLMTLLILAYKAWLFRGFGSMPENAALAGMFCGGSLLFLLARWLKKRSGALAAGPAEAEASPAPGGAPAVARPLTRRGWPADDRPVLERTAPAESRIDRRG